MTDNIEQEEKHSEHHSFKIDGVDLADAEVESENPFIRYYDYYEDRQEFGDVRVMDTPKDTKAKKEEIIDPDKQEQDQTYLRVDTSYDYGVDTRATGDFFVEGCEMVCNGLKCRVQKGKESWSILVIFNNDNSEHTGWVEFQTKMFMHTAVSLSAIKGKLKMFRFNSSSLDDAAATGLKYPINYPRDETSAEIIEGSAPYQWLNLVPTGTRKTTFTFPGAGRDEYVDWKLLQRSRFKFIPCFHISHIYCGGGKMSIQQKLCSAIITDISPNSITPRNIGTADTIAKAVPGIADKIRSQLDFLTSIKMSEESPDAGTVVIAEEGGKPTFSGIKGTTNSSFNTPSLNTHKTPASVKEGVTPSVRSSGLTPKTNPVPGGKGPARTPAGRTKF